MAKYEVLGESYDYGSWGEIAATLNVSERRAQQYESEGRIRVHRPRGVGANVYARLSELKCDLASWDRAMRTSLKYAVAV